MKRVVSMIASSTEIVCALGFEEWLVGRSHECDFPRSVTRLPALTAPKLRTDASSREIDLEVRSLVRDALSVYRVDPEALRELNPDLILTQTQCEVCAVSKRDVEAAVRSWTKSPPEIVSLEPNSLADIWEDIRRVARALGAMDRGEELVERIAARIAAVARRVHAAKARPSAACIEWIDPLMAAGNWVPELVELAGGENLFGSAGAHSPWMSLEELAAKDPEIIVVMPCGFDIARSRVELPALARRPLWPKLRAVQDGRVYLADGNQYFNRPGPRVVESLEILAEILHPGLFPPAHRGAGYEAA